MQPQDRPPIILDALSRKDGSGVHIEHVPTVIYKGTDRTTAAHFNYHSGGPEETLVRRLVVTGLKPADDKLLDVVAEEIGNIVRDKELFHTLGGFAQALYLRDLRDLREQFENPAFSTARGQLNVVSAAGVEPPVYSMRVTLSAILEFIKSRPFFE